MQLGIVPVIIPNVADKSTVITVEPFSSVDLRLLKKALSPPVTIKNFFRPCPSENNTSKALQSSGLSSQSEKTVDSTERLISDPGQSTLPGSTNGIPQGNSSSGKKSVVLGNTLKIRAKQDATLKRPAEDSLQRTDSMKRCKKQGSILTAFQNSSRLAQTPMQCPICKTSFSPSASNKAINEHMDNCLIK